MATKPPATSTAWANIAIAAPGAETPGSDLDRDTVTDDRERALRSNPDDPDTDKDGFSDGFEDRLADFDGLGDGLEQRLGSSPRQVDSNGDGISDFMAYSADESPVGPPLNKSLGELIGIPYSPAMGTALESVREGGAFPRDLARELPYPDVTATAGS